MKKSVTISSELRKLKKIFASIEKNKQDVAIGLIESAAFMRVELQKLEEHIAEHGCTEEYQNGANQFGKKKSSEVEVYNVMIKNYASIIKQLNDLLPDGESGADQLLDFIGGKKN